MHYRHEIYKRTDVNIAQRSQSLPEFLNLRLVCLDLLTLLILRASLLFNVESQVLEQNHLAVLCLVDSFLDFLAYAVIREGHALAELLLEFGDNRLERVLLVDFAVGAAEVGHEDDGLCAVVDSIFDGGDCADDALVVGDLFVGVERDVEVDLCGAELGVIARVKYRMGSEGQLKEFQEGISYTNEDTLAVEVTVGDGELVGERHGGG